MSEIKELDTKDYKLESELSKLQSEIKARAVCPSCGDEFSLDQKIRMAHDVMKYELEITKLKRANEILTKAVDFYADQKQMNHGLEITCEETAFVNEDDFQSIDEVEPNEYREHFYYVYGKKARQTLAEVDLILKGAE